MTVLFWDRVNANASCSSARLTISGAPPTGVAAGTSGDALGVFADLRDRGGGVGGHPSGVRQDPDPSEAPADLARPVPPPPAPAPRPHLPLAPLSSAPPQ